MLRREFLKLGAFAVAGLSGCGTSVGGAAGRRGIKGGRPNVILIMVDDQGYGDLACHGNPVVKTPALDRLHAESVRFTNFHVNPFCAPTRASLLLG